MIHPHLENPKSIAVIGASENMSKPGGKVLENLLNGNFPGEIYAVNSKPFSKEGVIHVLTYCDLPKVDLAILAIPAQSCVEVVKHLAQEGTGAFIIFSAGFGEAGEEGKKREDELREVILAHNATLIGPNCIGIINASYAGVFTSPVPEYHQDGCELISSSGATAVFIMEAAHSTGLKFSNIYSIGNAAQTGVEDLLEHLDHTYEPGNSSPVKLLYLEQIKHPYRFLKYASSLIRKGCHIAAIKAGYSEAGGRAASSHTGAMATSDVLIRALFKKAGIVYCSSREELISVAGVWQNKTLRGKNIAIITHAGGSAVMLTDALTSLGMNVPPISETDGARLLPKLYPGSSVTNPIDFLATGTAEQLGEIIDFCAELPEIDGMVVVFGSPGLFNVQSVYEVLHKKMSTCVKPIYPVLPSLVNAAKEIQEFIDKGHINFSDEVMLGKALAHAYQCPAPADEAAVLPKMDIAKIRSLINESSDGYMEAGKVRQLMEAAGLETVREMICQNLPDLKKALASLNFPLVMKVLGPVHKTDVGGVSLNINSEQFLLKEFDRLMGIKGAQGVLVQEMARGEELFCGAVRNSNFGHLIICGLGGIFVEILKDTAYGLAPLNYKEASNMVKSLRGYPIIQGYRGRNGVDEKAFTEAVVRVSSLVYIAPEIEELDINPFIGNREKLLVADARVKLTVAH